MTHNRISLRKSLAVVAALLASASIYSACSSTTSTTPPATPRTGTITQADLDAVPTVALDTGITGDPSVAFGTDTLTTLHKMRDLFGSVSKTTAISEGNIFVRKSWFVSTASKHNRDSVLNFVVMVKREPGYYTDGGDWEYIKIPYKAGTDYVAHPFGLLPADTSTSTAADMTKTNLRGRLQTQCGTCHAGATGSDFLFSR